MALTILWIHAIYVNVNFKPQYSFSNSLMVKETLLILANRLLYFNIPIILLYVANLAAFETVVSLTADKRILFMVHPPPIKIFIGNVLSLNLFTNL